MVAHNFLITVLILAGVAIRYQVAKRRFNRRGWGGVAYFKSYSASLLIRAVEKAVSVFALLCIIAALLLMASGFINKH
ncbi:hypothetical protein [Mucilaginibacter ginkgonis]|uniref:Molybdenum ABC transporter permease n=1 Tax=Mucilaginibacter ginkgonis TaxID=2682091 RepID=A0A6I4IMW2_9SPHI|nr:hypothetical protein [Mucilaginibacter ginkgonis]QQL49998.1 hypothetical protein GO620_000680 [Mucilaginibacter ginkgonis]